MRVRWWTLARWVGAGLAALLALQALPPLLRPPAPEPLAADIGLPHAPAPSPAGQPPGTGMRPPVIARVLPARALPTSRTRPRPATPAPPPPEPPSPAPAPSPSPPPAPAPAPVPVPAPAPPPPPGDGSIEFAPH